MSEAALVEESQEQAESISQNEVVPKYDPSINRFANVEAHVFGGENDKKDE